MSWVATGVAVAGSMLSSSSANKSARASAIAAGRKAGKNRAQMDMAKARANALLPARAREVNESAVLADAQVQKDETSAVASATVAAAAAGVSGANVDQTAQSIGGNAAMVQEGLERQRLSGLLQIGQEYEDNWWEADNQKYTAIATKNTGSPLLAAGLDGLGAYTKAGGFEQTTG